MQQQRGILDHTKLTKTDSSSNSKNCQMYFTVQTTINMVAANVSSHNKSSKHQTYKKTMQKMRNQALSFSLFILFSVLIMSLSLSVDAKTKTCKPSGKLKGKKPPKDQCNQSNDSDCCEEGKSYNIYKCSPPVSSHTKAVLTLNGFEKGKDGGGPAECDGNYHSDDIPIVAMSTGWFNNMKRCFKNITIYGNGKSVDAMVVDECDSTKGCDEEHDYQPPCNNNIVDASRAVWKALGVPKKERGEMKIFWSDA